MSASFFHIIQTFIMSFTSENHFIQLVPIRADVLLTVATVYCEKGCAPSDFNLLTTHLIMQFIGFCQIHQFLLRHNLATYKEQDSEDVVTI